MKLYDVSELGRKGGKILLRKGDDDDEDDYFNYLGGTQTPTLADYVESPARTF